MSENEGDVNLIKRGETVVQATFHRCKDGLKVWVRALPAIEDMIISLGTGEAEDVRSWGRQWVPEKKEELLQVWNLSAPACSGTLGTGKTAYRLDQPGQALLEGNVINLSFLRLKGISEQGITFTVKGVATFRQVKDIADRVVDASRDFYVSFLKPVDIAIRVSTEDLNAGAR